MLRLKCIGIRATIYVLYVYIYILLICIYIYIMQWYWCAGGGRWGCWGGSYCGGRPIPRPGSTLCGSLRCQNAHGHSTRVILCGKNARNQPDTDGNTSIKQRASIITVRTSHCGHTAGEFISHIFPLKTHNHVPLPVIRTNQTPFIECTIHDNPTEITSYNSWPWP